MRADTWLSCSPLNPASIITSNNGKHEITWMNKWVTPPHLSSHNRPLTLPHFHPTFLCNLICMLLPHQSSKLTLSHPSLIQNLSVAPIKQATALRAFVSNPNTGCCLLFLHIWVPRDSVPPLVSAHSTLLSLSHTIYSDPLYVPVVTSLVFILFQLRL